MRRYLLSAMKHVLNLRLIGTVQLQTDAAVTLSNSLIVTELKQHINIQFLTKARSDDVILQQQRHVY